MEIDVNELMSKIEIFHRTSIMCELIEMITPFAEIELPSLALGAFGNAFYDYMVSDDDRSEAEIAIEHEKIQTAFDVFIKECGIDELNDFEKQEFDRGFELIYSSVYKAVAKFIIAKFNPENKPLVTNSI
jgi:hypothetical protein